MYKKSMLWILLALGIIGSAIFLVGFKWEGRCGGRWHGHNKDAMIKRMDNMVKDLKLTGEQQAKFDELKKKMTENMGKGPQMDREHYMDGGEKDGFRDEMMTELKKDNPDVNSLAGKVKSEMDQKLVKQKERLEQRTANSKECIDLFVNFYNMLDDNQKKLLVNKVHKKIDAMETLRED
ncbi:MAG: Spy/CpxP family protein refolding chaperone [Candidatus Eremiobacterota bacterium]